MQVTLAVGVIIYTLRSLISVMERETYSPQLLEEEEDVNLITIPFSDMIVVVAFSTEEYFAIEMPKQTYKNQAGFKPDFTLHEIGLAAEMLLTGDARM
jgi:hypothetical protein